MPVYKDKTATKDGRSWYYLTYKKIGGVNKKIKSKRFLTKKEAQQAESVFLLKKDSPMNKPFSLVAKDYFNEMYKIRKESTVFCYENIYYKNIDPFFNKYNINDITVQDIKDWHNYIEKKRFKLSYANKLYTILNSIFIFAEKNYNLTKNVCHIVGCFQDRNDEIKADKEKIRYITYDEFNSFISVIDDITWKTFFIFLYYTGMRKAEVQALTWNKINLDTKEIYVDSNLSTKTRNSLYKITNTKNSKNRVVKINNILYNQLVEYKKYIMKYKDFTEDWFVFGCVRFLPETTINRYKHKYFEMSGVREITIHEFRHSHVSLLINEYVKTSKEKNMKVDTAKFFLIMSNRMGHTIQVMQNTYMHLFPTIQDEIVDLLDNL